MTNDWGTSGFVWDVVKTEVSGAQLSVFWYRRWLPLVTLGAGRWSLSVGWTDTGGSGRGER